MPKAKDPAKVLAENMVLVLEAQRQLGPAAYPLSLTRLAELTDPSAPPDLILKAVKCKPFPQRVIVNQPKDLGSPLALVEDAEQLAASPLLLTYAMEAVCNADSPACPLAKVRMKVATKLRPLFTSAVERQIAEQRLPPGIGVITEGKKTLLHLQRYPLPKKPEEVLAERMIEALKSRRDRVTDYPARLADLVAAIAPAPSEALLKKALQQPAYVVAVAVVSFKPKKAGDAIVALAADLPVVLEGAVLLELLLRQCVTSENQIAGVEALAKKLAPAHRDGFLAAVQRRIITRSLPAMFGSLLQAGKRCFFFVQDVLASSPLSPRFGGRGAGGEGDGTPATILTPGAVAIGEHFDAAFERLDRQAGHHNFVSLMDLRQAVGGDRSAFDAELLNLRRAGRYTLSAAEGRHGLSPEERAAGIEEDGAVLLYVSRKLS